MTPAEFSQNFMPYAQRVSQRTGLDPRLVLAQAALETGYGRSAPNNNYFGIKSHGKSGGSSLMTKEFEGGRMVSKPQSFRGYADPSQSFEGYADFILSNPRYKKVLGQSGLSNQIAAMGESGYATDPKYASKLRSIANRFGADMPTQPATVNTQGTAPMMQQEEETPRGLLGGLGIQKMQEGAPGETGQRFFQRDSFKDTAALLAQGFGRMGVMGMEEIADGIAKQRTEAKAKNKTVEYLRKSGRNDLADAVESGSLGGSQAATLMFSKAKGPSAKEAQIQRLMSTGVSEDIAIGIADGRLVVSRDPVTGAATIVDKAQLPSAEAALPVAAVADSADPAGTFEGTNVKGALGLSGFGSNIINTVVDAFGGKQPADKISDAATALESLSTKTSLGIAAEFPGRPSNLTREMVTKLTVLPNELRLGPGKALNKAENLLDMIEKSLAAANGVVEGRFSPTDKAAAQSSISQLTPLLADYQSLVTELRKSTTPPPASVGNVTIRPDVATRLEQYK